MFLDMPILHFLFRLLSGGSELLPILRVSLIHISTSHSLTFAEWFQVSSYYQFFTFTSSQSYFILAHRYTETHKEKHSGTWIFCSNNCFRCNVWVIFK